MDDSDNPILTEWKLGPHGELGLVPIQWSRLRSYLFRVSLPLFVLMLLDPSWATATITTCSIFILIRFSRLEGTDALVQGALSHWGRILGGASVALYALYRLQLILHNSTSETAYNIGWAGYIIGVYVFISERLLLTWEPYVPAFAMAEVSISELNAAHGEFVDAKEALRSLPVFDDSDPELLQAWQARDTMRIAAILQKGNLLTQQAWRDATVFHNDAVALIDRARNKLNRLLLLSQKRLAYFNIDYTNLEVDRSKLAHLTLTRAIPRRLSSSRVNAQHGAFLHGYSRVVVQGTLGSISPAEFLVGLGIVFVMQKIIVSRMLRRLKDIEGKLKYNARIARGDFSIISTVLETRIIPQLEQITSLVERLEEGLLALPREPEPSAPSSAGSIEDPLEKEKALRLAFAMIEGRKLVGMAAGD